MKFLKVAHLKSLRIINDYLNRLAKNDLAVFFLSHSAIIFKTKVIYVGVIITKYYMSVYLSGYSFETGSCSGSTYFQCFFLMAFLQEAFVRNII